jgi:RNA-directed DNA polymerase
MKSDHIKTQEALWLSVVEAGGPRKYVEQKLRERGVYVTRKDVLSMGFKEKKAYIEKVQAEEAVRRPLQAEVWGAYTALHIVHLGEEIFWQGDVSVDFFDSAHLDQRLKQRGLPAIETPEQLCEALGLTLSELRWLCYHREAATSIHYRQFTLPKKSGGVRQIWAPLPKLKAAQHWILRNIAERLTVHGAAHGFIPGRSIYSNAVEHSDAQVVVSLDLADFFPTFTFKRVKGIFRRAGYLDGIATLLALLCTEAPREVVDHEGQRFYVALGPRCLPQGSPASPALTNAACLRLDRRLIGWAEKAGWRYTRYADDLTFSVPNDVEGSPNISQLLGVVRGIVEDEGLVIRSDKTHVMRKGGRQAVTGLIINGEATPRPKREVRRRVRAMIHNLKVGRGLHEGDSLNMLIGHIAFIHMCDPQEGKTLLDQLRQATQGEAQPQGEEDQKETT